MTPARLARYGRAAVALVAAGYAAAAAWTGAWAEFRAWAPLALVLAWTVVEADRGR